MSIYGPAEPSNPHRHRPCLQSSTLAERLHAYRVHAYRVRLQINAAHDDDRRRLLADRLDAADAKAADFAARLRQMGAP